MRNVSVRSSTILPPIPRTMIYSHFGTVISIRRGENLPNINVGDEFPNFELPDQQVSPWVLSGQLELGAAMFVFYRGDW